MLEERELLLPGGSMVLAVIGSSHFLEMRAGDAVLCELLACPRPDLQDAPIRIRLAGRMALAHRLQVNGLGYRFDLSRRDWSEPEFETESIRLSSPAPGRMQFVFPAREDTVGAITCLEWQASGGQVSVATWHTFPAESSIVHTRTVIDIAETGATS